MGFPAAMLEDTSFLGSCTQPAAVRAGRERRLRGRSRGSAPWSAAARAEDAGRGARARTTSSPATSTRCRRRWIPGRRPAPGPRHERPRRALLDPKRTVAGGRRPAGEAPARHREREQRPAQQPAPPPPGPRPRAARRPHHAVPQGPGRRSCPRCTLAAPGDRAPRQGGVRLLRVRGVPRRRIAQLDVRDQLVVAGIESHICVAQTVLGALGTGFTVHVAADAVGSRTAENREVGLRRMERAGAVSPARRWPSTSCWAAATPPPSRRCCPTSRLTPGGNRAPICVYHAQREKTRTDCGLAVNTGGGDAPGLNAVLRAVTLTALNRGFEVFGIQKGYLGLLDTKYLVPLTSDSVRGITHLGGSILGTNNRGNPLAIRVVEGGQERYVDVSDQAVDNFRDLGFDGLIAIGGDGSLKIAGRPGQEGHPHHRRPQDDRQRPRRHLRDLRLRDRGGHRHRRHRQAALHGGEPRARDGGRGHGPLLRMDRAARRRRRLRRRDPDPRDPLRPREGLPEGHAARAGRPPLLDGGVRGGRAARRTASSTTIETAHDGREARLGGIAEKVAAEIAKRTGKETRSMVLGHLQRGGSRPRTTGCSPCATAPPPCAWPRKAGGAPWSRSTRRR